MGAYLSKPVTEKISEWGSNERVRYAATTMQGWRINQEDAHNCIIDFDESCSFFAVYDGHGGSEVAQYTAQHLPDMLKTNSSWFAGDYVKAIEDTFLDLDSQLRSEEVLKELKKLAGTVASKREESSDDEEDKQALYEEAGMPIETILQKYGIVLRRDRNGKQSLIDFEEFRTQIEEQNTTESKVEDKGKSEKHVQENGTANSESMTSEKGRNGDAIEDNKELMGRNNLKDPAEEVMEEKTKKRVCDSSPSCLSAKRTKSSQDLEEDSVENQCTNFVSSSVEVNKSEADIKDERNEGSKSELETAGPVRENVAKTICADVVGAGDSCMSLSDNPQPSATPDIQNAFSSDSEQSVDEDYNVDEEMSEGDEEEEDEDEDDETDKVEPTYSSSPGDTPGEDSGTTACVAILYKDKVVVGNAGDSRAVLSRKGNAIELSTDHKPEDDTERRRIEAAGGEISLDGRVNGGLNLSRALGDHYYKKNDALPLKDQMISALPDVKEYKITEDDEFIIVACDGIWNSLTSQEAVDFVRQRISSDVNLKDICEQICDHCLSPNTAGDGTGCDNMTIIVAQLLRSTPSES